MNNLVYLVEMWSNKRKKDPYSPDGEECHYVSVAHIASSEKSAREWARNNLTYGGTRKDHPGHWFPWHFRIRQWLVNEDTCAVVHNHDVHVGNPIHPRKYHIKDR